MTSRLDTRIILVFYIRVTYNDIKITSNEYYIIHLSHSFTQSLLATHIDSILDGLEPIWVPIIVIATKNRILYTIILIGAFHLRTRLYNIMDMYYFGVLYTYSNGNVC